MKTNKKFLLLSFWGIIFVVLGHCSGLHKNMFFCNIFPFYSFHMALFIFISGYFYKKSPAKKFFVKKTKKIIISYLIWNLIYGIIVNILKNLGVINYGKDLTLYNIFIAPFMTYSNQFHFNSPAWFLISIYFVQVIYCIIDKINIKDYKINKYIVFIISSIIASITLKSALNGNNYGIWILITRVSFLFPFYCLGQIYKDLEKYDKLPISNTRWITWCDRPLVYFPNIYNYKDKTSWDRVVNAITYDNVKNTPDERFCDTELYFPTTWKYVWADMWTARQMINQVYGWKLNYRNEYGKSYVVIWFFWASLFWYTDIWLVNRIKLLK